MLVNRGKRQFFRDFSFFLDVTDATRYEPSNIFKELGRPVLALSASSQDCNVIPIPDAHMMAGLSGVGGFEHLFSESERHVVHSMQHKYRTSLELAWSRKLPKAVYRGGCIPTQNPATVNDLYTIRSKMCVLFHNSSLVDVGLVNIPVGHVSGVFHRLEQECTPCSQAAPLTADEMKQYKFQINVDGFGTSWDGTFWKLASNSVVIWVMTDTESHWQPLWLPFYYPMLKPFQHYVPAQVHMLEHVIRWYSQRDHVAQRIAKKARSVAMQLTGDLLLAYLREVLFMAHDACS